MLQETSPFRATKRALQPARVQRNARVLSSIHSQAKPVSSDTGTVGSDSANAEGAGNYLGHGHSLL